MHFFKKDAVDKSVQRRVFQPTSVHCSAAEETLMGQTFGQKQEHPLYRSSSICSFFRRPLVKEPRQPSSLTFKLSCLFTSKAIHVFFPPSHPKHTHTGWTSADCSGLMQIRNLISHRKFMVTSGKQDVFDLALCHLNGNHTVAPFPAGNAPTTLCYWLRLLCYISGGECASR